MLTLVLLVSIQFRIMSVSLDVDYLCLQKYSAEAVDFLPCLATPKSRDFCACLLFKQRLVLAVVASSVLFRQQRLRRWKHAMPFSEGAGPPVECEQRVAFDDQMMKQTERTDDRREGDRKNKREV